MDHLQPASSQRPTQDRGTVGFSSASPALSLPAMKPSAAAYQCLVSARWFAECCGRRNKPDPSGLSSSPSREEEAPQQAQERLQVQEVHHHWLHHLQVDPHLLCHWPGSALCSLIWGAR